MCKGSCHTNLDLGGSVPIGIGVGEQQFLDLLKLLRGIRIGSSSESIGRLNFVRFKNHRNQLIVYRDLEVCPFGLGWFDMNRDQVGRDLLDCSLSPIEMGGGC